MALTSKLTELRAFEILELLELSAPAFVGLDFFDDPSPKLLATRTARAGQQYVEGRRGACLEALSINSLSSDSNVGFRAPWDTSENRDVPLTTR